MKVAGDKQDALDKQPQAKTARAPARANPKNPGIVRDASLAPAWPAAEVPFVEAVLGLVVVPAAVDVPEEVAVPVLAAAEEVPVLVALAVEPVVVGVVAAVPDLAVSPALQDWVLG